MVYAYLRVSTDKQDGQNQRLGIDALATARGLKIDEYIDDEGVSGTKEPEKRELGKLLKRLQPGDILLAGELSRLGRSLFMIFRILEYCLNNNVTVMTAKDGYTLGNDIQSKVMAFAFGLSAEIERDMISRRTKEALQRKRENGVILGRPKGRKTNPECHKLYGKDIEILECLTTKKMSQRQTAKAYGVDRNTLVRFIDNSDILKGQKARFEKRAIYYEHKHALSPHLEEIKLLCSFGVSRKEIAERYDVSYPTVSGFIRKFGIEEKKSKQHGND